MKDVSIEIQDLPQTRLLIVHDLFGGDDVNVTRESTCNNSLATMRESCLSLEHARNDCPVPLDRWKVVCPHRCECSHQFDGPANRPQTRTYSQTAYSQTSFLQRRLIILSDGVFI